MSRNYSYILIGPKEEAQLLLKNTFTICTTFSNNSLEFPDGSSITGSFSAGISVGRRVQFSGRIPNAKLPVAMSFPTGDYLHKTRFAQGQSTTLEGIDLEIFLGNKYAFFRYQAANGKISRLFENADAIKQAFKQLAEDSNCLLAMFDKQESTCYLLDEVMTAVPSNQSFIPNPVFEKPERLDFYVESFLENAVNP